jgi:hypothetical protein
MARHRLRIDVNTVRNDGPQRPRGASDEDEVTDESKPRYLVEESGGRWRFYLAGKIEIVRRIGRWLISLLQPASARPRFHGVRFHGTGFHYFFGPGEDGACKGFYTTRMPFVRTEREAIEVARISVEDRWRLEEPYRSWNNGLVPRLEAETFQPGFWKALLFVDRGHTFYGDDRAANERDRHAGGLQVRGFGVRSRFWGHGFGVRSCLLRQKIRPDPRPSDLADL